MTTLTSQPLAVFKTYANSVMLGTGFENPYGRWTKVTALDTVDLSKIHGHISALSEDTFGENNQKGQYILVFAYIKRLLILTFLLLESTTYYPLGPM
jgi:hypothetical protein